MSGFEMNYTPRSSVYYDNYDDRTSALPISATESVIKRMVEPNERVINHQEIVIQYDYPLGGTYGVEHKRKAGWTREALFKVIQKDYREFYRRPAHYGIWGHSIRDLVVEKVFFSPKTKMVKLYIGS